MSRDTPPESLERLVEIAHDECIHDHEDSETVAWAAEEIDTLRRVVRQLLVKPLVDDEHMARTLAQVHSLDHEQAAAVERADRKRRAWTDVS